MGKKIGFPLARMIRPLLARAPNQVVISTTQLWRLMGGHCNGPRWGAVLAASIPPGAVVWAPQPLRPSLPCQVIRGFVYIFAAARAPLGRLTALLLPTANTEMMALFLAQVAQEFSESLEL